MELKYIVMTIIKILISVPCILLFINHRVEGAALMGGHLDNTRNSSFSNFSSDSYEMYDDSQDYFNPSNTTTQSETNSSMVREKKISEEIPDPSALVLPGYNLPENIFNKGKPFYLEKDPLTGKVDFDSRTSLLNSEEDEFEYIDDDPNIYEKSNIDRKDGSLASHKSTDVNQLTPNFHDFLNLPVKYNPDKYVYPLISSSYANTKVQGNLNKYQSLNNHKISYVVTTYKPTVSPTYYTVKTPFYIPNDKVTIFSTTTTTTTPTTRTTTTTRPTTEKVHSTTTTKSPNLMNSAMVHPSFEEYTSPKPKPEDIYLTTRSVNDIYLTTKRYQPSSTTKRTLSLFEQLFGEYDDLTTTEKPFKPPGLFQNLPNNKNKYPEENTEINKVTQEKDYHNILTGSNMGHENAYEYEDDYGNIPSESENNVYQTKPVKYEQKTTLPAPSSTTPSSTTTLRTTTTTTKPTTTTSTTTTTSRPITEPDVSTDYDPSMPGNNDYDLDLEESGKFEPEYKKPQPTTVQPIMSTKVTSLPLGENHFGTQDLRPPIIAMTHNLKEQLNNEKVKPFNHPIPSSSSIRISPDQDSVSFVVGHHQNVGGGFVGTSFKEGPFDNSPFRPLIIQADNDKDTVSYTVQAKPEFVKPIFSQNFPPQPKITEVVGSSANIQPIRTSEASLSIGVPINGIKKVPGLVVDENLENEKIEFPKKGTGAKIIFPDNKEERISTYTPDLIPPPKEQPLPSPNREILQLNSKPMYHQLPSNLTPPNEQEIPPPHLERPRPPWDPRPGHFYNGRPEYIRPPRPQAKPAPGEMYKRIDNLPNVPPMFRPTANGPHYLDYMGPMKNGYIRQALLERPSNRPIGLFEKLVPPPPSKNVHNLRKVSMLEHDLRLRNAEKQEQYEFYQHNTPPPQPILSNRRKAEEPAIETLQMIQAKQGERKEVVKTVPIPSFKNKVTSENPLYVVYPVTSAIKLDVIDPGKKETVVVGTRAELPLRPSKINTNQEFNFENPQDRNDSPILKPHPKPINLPIKSDFPYLLERPDITSTAAVTFSNPQVANNLDTIKEDSKYASNNQWGAVQDAESRILTGPKINYKNPNQISVTLKTYTEKPKPIAVAYTPTEPYKRLESTEKYSLPNYADPVISEIRPSGLIDKKAGSEITVSAVMHTHSQMDLGSQSINGKPNFVYNKKIFENHKVDLEESPPKLDFQAPFQASVNVDGMSQGWTVVRNNESKSKIDRSDQVEETTTVSVATTSEFDIENFKPQLFGGFKPLYSYPEEVSPKSDETELSEREERTT